MPALTPSSVGIVPCDPPPFIPTHVPEGTHLFLLETPQTASPLTRAVSELLVNGVLKGKP